MRQEEPAITVIMIIVRGLRLRLADELLSSISRVIHNKYTCEGPYQQYYVEASFGHCFMYKVLVFDYPMPET